MNLPDLPWRELSAVFSTALAIEAGRYLLTAGLVSVIIWTFWRTWFHARKIQPRRASPADYRRELLASARTALIFALTGFAMYLAARAGWLTIYDDFSRRGPAYLVASLVAMILAHDAYFYWMHRAMHHPRLFRAFHWTHHRSKSPTPWTAYAFDPGEAIVTVAFVPLWAALVPMHDLALFVFVTWQIVRNVMGHAGVELSPVSGRPSRLFGWLCCTIHHDLHHQHGRGDYGLYFTWWDRLMGTEHPDYQARVAEVAARSRSTARGAVSPVRAAVLVLLTLGVAGATVAAAKAERAPVIAPTVGP